MSNLIFVSHKKRIFFPIVHDVPFEGRVSQNFDLGLSFHVIYGTKRETFCYFFKLDFLDSIKLKLGPKKKKKGDTLPHNCPSFMCIENFKQINQLSREISLFKK